MKLKLENFGGIGPMVHPKLLPPNMATSALDCLVTSGALAPLMRGKDVTNSGLLSLGASTSGIKTLYKYGLNTGDTQYWLNFLEDVDICRGQIADDTSERTYLTGYTSGTFDNGGPKMMTFPSAASTPPYPAAAGVVSLAVNAPSASFVLSSGSIINKSITAFVREAPKLTLVTAARHGIANTGGQTLHVLGADQSEYNGQFYATVVDEYTLEAPAVGTASTLAKATGSMSAYLGVANISAVTYNTRTGKVVVTTSSAHGIKSDQFVTIRGLVQEEFNVADVSAVVESDTQFSYFLDDGLNPPLSESIVGTTTVALRLFTNGSVGKAYIGRKITVTSASISTKITATTAVDHGFETATYATIITTDYLKGDRKVTPVTNQPRQFTFLVSGYQTATPVATGQYNLSTESSIPETRVYIYTEVVKTGGIEMESAPSPASDPIEVHVGQGVKLDFVSRTNTSASNWRIYRSTGSELYLFVAEVAAVNGTFFVDEVAAEDLGESCPTIEFEAPLASLRGLVNLPNGMMAAFNKDTRDLYFCEPYKPHAWPSKYSLTMDYKIVGLGVYQGVLVVLTEGCPYIISGTDPSSMTQQKVDLMQSCVSKRSIVSVGHGVIYASPNGLCYVGSQGASLLTGSLFDFTTWQSYKPESINAYNYDGAYVGFYDTGTVKAGFMFDMRNQRSVFMPLSQHTTAGYLDPKTGKLFVLERRSTSNYIVQFNAGTTPYTYSWTSKVFETPSPTSFGALQVLADSYPVSVTVTATDTTGANYTQVLNVTSTQSVRLNSGFLARDWKISVSGTKVVQSVLLANSPTELKSV